ncbi:MAG: lipopolysaccharide biosynthesis protein [Cytophagales bacterium]
MKIPFTILKEKSALVLVDQALVSGSSFIVTFAIARLLTIADFGFYSALLLTVYLLVSVCNAWVIQPLQTAYAKEPQKESYLGFAFYAQVGLLVIITISLLTVTRFPLFSSVIPGWQAILFINAFLMHDYLRKCFLVIDAIKKIFWMDLVLCIIQTVVLILSFSYTTVSLTTLILYLGFSYMFAGILGICFLKVNFYEFHYRKFFLLNHIDQGKWLFLTAVVQWWSGNFFAVTAGIILGPLALAALRLVQSMFGILNVVLQAYENYALPFAFSLHQRSADESKKYLRDFSFKGGIIMMLVLAILFLFSNEIIHVAGGEQYDHYAYLLKGMALLYLIIFVGYPIRIAIRIKEMNHLIFIGYVLSFVFSVLFAKFLLKEYQLLGALIGLIANQLILLLFWQYNLIKHHYILWK